MMRNQLRSFLLEGHPERIASIDICRVAGGKELCHLAICEVRKDALTIVNQWANIESLDEVLTLVPRHLPVCLTFGTGQVINKSCGLIDDKFEVENWIANEGFPGLDKELFVYQMVCGFNNLGFVSIVRKEAFVSTVTKIIDKGFLLIEFRVGYFGFQHFAAEMNWSKQSVLVGDLLLSFEKELVKDFSLASQHNTEEDLPQNLHTVNPLCLASISTAFSVLFRERSNMERSSCPLIEEQATHLRYKNILFKHGKWLAVFLFVLLLCNAVLYMWLKEENDTLEKDISDSQLIIGRVEKVRIAVLNRQQIIRRLGLGDNKKLTVKADRIAAAVPDEIKLARIVIQPIKKKGTQDVVFPESGVTIIQGNSSSAVGVELFLKALRVANPGYDVQLTTYLYSDETEDIAFSVKIEPDNKKNIFNE